MTHSIHRRQVFSLIGALALSPRIAVAQETACDLLAGGLSLCPAPRWVLQPTLEGATASLLSANGITASIRFDTGLTPDQLSGARWTIGHAPISARAMVLTTGFAYIDGQLATSVSYLPRHANPAIVVAMTDVIGEDFTLVASTVESGVTTYSENHRHDHAALIAALRLDRPK
jgi:hypothetical protein